MVTAELGNERFSSVPRLSAWSFQRLIYGGVLPPPHCPDMSGPAVSPIDKSRKDSGLPPVTSEKAHYLLSSVKIWTQEKAMNIKFSKS